MSVEDPRYDDAADAVRRMLEQQAGGPSVADWAQRYRDLNGTIFAFDVGREPGFTATTGGRAAGKSYTAQKKARRGRINDYDDLFHPRERTFDTAKVYHRDQNGQWQEVRAEDIPPPRRDYYSARRWKDQPVPPGEQPFVVMGDGTIDLHPSQWSVR